MHMSCFIAHAAEEAYFSGSLDVEVDVVAAKGAHSRSDRTRSLGQHAYFPPGAPPQFSEAICIKPASPLPPVAPGLQVDSCMANEASMIGWTGR